MNRIKTLASTLCPGCNGAPCVNCQDAAASILTDPGRLLATLADLGLVRQESDAHRCAAGCRQDETRTRYVTDWRAEKGES